MTEEQAKEHLRSMLVSFTPGSVLHLLGDLCEEFAEDARRGGDEERQDQYRLAGHALLVVGMGIDAALPR